MKDKQAIRFFHGPQRYNCAQAVLTAFQTESGLPDCAIEAASGSGGGKATDGWCGALHAVRVLMENGEHFDDVVRTFTAMTGSPRCMDIRSRRTLPCSGCVSLAARLLEQHQAELRPDDQGFVAGLENRIQSLLPVQGECACAQIQATQADAAMAVRLHT